MESKDHLLASSLAAPVLTYFLYEPLSVTLLVFYSIIGTSVGFLIDLDHYPAYRYVSGDWRDLKKTITNPRSVLQDHTTITVVSERKKYLAHAVSFSLVLIGFWMFWRELLPLAASVLALHLLMDLYATYKNGPVPPQTS